jgi:hypothetical protein
MTKRNRELQLEVLRQIQAEKEEEVSLCVYVYKSVS